MTARSNTDTAARRNNAAWDAFFAIKKIVLEETKSATLHQIVSRKYKAIDYTQPAAQMDIDGKKMMGMHAWIDNSIPPQIVVDVRKALKHCDIDKDTKAIIFDLTGIYLRLRDLSHTDPTHTMAYLRQTLIGKWGNTANIVNF